MTLLQRCNSTGFRSQSLHNVLEIISDVHVLKLFLRRQKLKLGAKYSIRYSIPNYTRAYGTI